MAGCSEVVENVPTVRSQTSHDKKPIMSDSPNCSKCGCAPDGTSWFHLSRNAETHRFCSRRCLVEFVAPELAKAIVVQQWIPTPEEAERMSQ